MFSAESVLACLSHCVMLESIAAHFSDETASDMRREDSCVCGEQVKGRMLMASYHVTSVPQWVAAKLQSAIGKNLTLPSCADIPLPYLMPIDHPDAAYSLPAFLQSLRPGLPSHQSQICMPLLFDEKIRQKILL